MPVPSKELSVRAGVCASDVAQDVPKEHVVPVPSSAGTIRQLLVPSRRCLHSRHRHKDLAQTFYWSQQMTHNCAAQSKEHVCANVLCGTKPKERIVRHFVRHRSVCAS